MAEKVSKSGFLGWEAAAERAGTSVGVLKVWVAEHTHFTSDRWSKWNHKKEPIPMEVVIDFLRAQVDEARRAAHG